MTNVSPKDLGPLAQLAEQDTLNVKVDGSTPSWPTTNYSFVKTFEILEHTADLKVRVRGLDLNDLFKNAGLAIFQICAEKKIIKEKNKHNFSISQKAQGLEELFVNWLNELLSLSAAKGV